MSLARSLPATWIRPSEGRSSLRISRRNVDLPEPEGPTRKTNSPFSTSIVTFSRAGRPWFGYVLVTLSKWITGPSQRSTECGRRSRNPAAVRPSALADCPVWPGASLGGRLAPNVQHRESGTGACRGRDPDELRRPDLRQLCGAGGRGTVPCLPVGAGPDTPPLGRP